MADKRVKVLIVDDSLFMREFLTRELSKDSALQVVGTAKDAYEARDGIVQWDPDVMTLDLDMPRMSGQDFLEKLMTQYPLPVIVVSGTAGGAPEAMAAGAVDYVDKARMKDAASRERLIAELTMKIKLASLSKAGAKAKPGAPAPKTPSKAEGPGLIAIGASTGGTEAVRAIVKALGDDLPGIIVVQHMPAGFTGMFAQGLNDGCVMQVREAKDGDVLLPGQVLIAPGQLQCQIVRRRMEYIVHCYPGEKVSGHAPSVDVLFRSVADAAGPRALGIILTGMGSDGAQGLLEMRRAGALTLGQDSESCIVYGMPKAAYDLGAVAEQVSLSSIPRHIYDWHNGRLHVAGTAEKNHGRD